MLLRSQYEREEESQADEVHQRVYLPEFAPRQLYRRVADEAETDAVAYIIGKRYPHHRQESREGFFEVVPVDIPDGLHHQRAHYHQRPGRYRVDEIIPCAGRDQVGRRGEAAVHEKPVMRRVLQPVAAAYHLYQRGEEGAEPEQQPGDHRREPGPAALGHAGGGFYIGGDGARAEKPAHGGRCGVHYQYFPYIAHGPVLVHEAGLLAHCHHRAHSVEKVGQHYREDGEKQARGQSLDQRQLPVHRLEGGEKSREAWRGESGVRYGRHAQQQRGAGGRDYAPEYVAFYLRGHEEGRGKKADEGDPDVFLREIPERDHGDRGRPDDPALVKPDDSDEKPDAHPDGPFQVERDGIHHGLAETRDHQQENKQPLDEDHGHPHLPGHIGLLEADDREGQHRVYPHAGGQRQRPVRYRAHQHAHHRRPQGRGRDR